MIPALIATALVCGVGGFMIGSWVNDIFWARHGYTGECVRCFGKRYRVRELPDVQE